MARFNNLALNVVLVLMGILVIAGSVLGSVGTTIFPFDQYIGTRASVAGVAFGVGVAAAGFQPAAHPTWVRLAILYCALDVVYEVVAWAYLGIGAFGLVPLVVSVIFGLLLFFLYPDRAALVPRSSGRPPAPARA